MHTVAVLALDQVHPLRPVHPDRGVHPHPAARRPPRPTGSASAPTGRRSTPGAFTLRAPWGLEALAERGHDHRARQPPTPPPRSRPRSATRCGGPPPDGTRIASICSGAFVLAATGLLDGLRATTHWLAAGLLAARHPDIDVDPDVLYVDNGQFLTSAGAAAGPGPVPAHDPPGPRLGRRRRRRPAVGHAAGTRGRTGAVHRARPAPTPQGSTLEPLLRWMEDNLGRDLTLADIAAHAGMSTRTLIRRFREQTGTTPAAVAAPRPDPPGPAPAGDHPALRRPHRRPGRLRLTHRLPRPLQTDHRRQPAHLPPRLQLTPARGRPFALSHAPAPSPLRPCRRSSPGPSAVRDEVHVGGGNRRRPGGPAMDGGHGNRPPPRIDGRGVGGLERLARDGAGAGDPGRSGRRPGSTRRARPTGAGRG